MKSLCHRICKSAKELSDGIDECVKSYYVFFLKTISAAGRREAARTTSQFHAVASLPSPTVSLPLDSNYSIL